MSTTSAAPSSPAVTAATPKYNHAIGYLRAFVVALVIAHHTAIAYHPFAPPPPESLLSQSRWWQAFPVVDSHRWMGFSLFVSFNDAFFMSLMFFLSGLFVWHGLERKGSARFLRNRLLRLGLPFLIAAVFFALLAYFPTYLQFTARAVSPGFWKQWSSLGRWPSGPAWFVWVLLAFDAIAALLFVVAPNWGKSLGAVTLNVARAPFAFFLSIAALSALVYMPMALHFNSLAWATFGPFTFQTSRIIHYLLYFLIGVAVGAAGIERGLLAPGGKLARRSFMWVLAALLFFAINTGMAIVAFSPGANREAWTTALEAGFVLSCAASCFAFLALFLRFARSQSRIFDGMSANSYGIYLVHYIFVSWLLYAFVPLSLPAVVKAPAVFIAALAVSWGVTAMLRHIPAVARVV